MQILQRQNKLSRIELTFGLWKIDFFNKMMTEVLSATKIQTKINVIRRLESKVKTNNKRMVYLL